MNDIDVHPDLVAMIYTDPDTHNRRACITHHRHGEICKLEKLRTESERDFQTRVLNMCQAVMDVIKKYTPSQRTYVNVN